jgi:methylmalonyl-CoA mutase cobalamin-binding subunit
MAIDLRTRLSELVVELRKNGLPSRTELAAAVVDTQQWKKEHQVAGLWENPPLMVTATIDDAMGHGLDLIHQYADLAGLRVHPLGLLQPAEAIIAACREMEPALLGLTVLQFDSEDALALIARSIPEVTRIVAGGPVFKADPEITQRAGIQRVAADAADFLSFLLTL